MEAGTVNGEFEASRKSPDFPRRMFQYFCQLFLRYDTEIITIAVFTDDAHWKAPVPDRFELGLAGKTFVQFEYHLIKLKHLDFRRFVDSANPLAFTLMAKMDYNRREQVRLKADFLRWIRRDGVYWWTSWRRTCRSPKASRRNSSRSWRAIRITWRWSR